MNLMTQIINRMKGIKLRECTKIKFQFVNYCALRCTQDTSTPSPRSIDGNLFEQMKIVNYDEAQVDCNTDGATLFRFTQRYCHLLNE